MVSGLAPLRIEETVRINRWARWLIPALFCVVLFAQLLLSVRQLSQHVDEATYLYSGYRYVKCGDLSVIFEHPPLLKIVGAAPLLAMNLGVDCLPFLGSETELALRTRKWFYNQPRTVLAYARMAVSVFAGSLCLLVWIAARKMFDATTAVLATSLLIFEPNLLAYGALVLNDLAVTCTLLFAVFGFYLWVTNRTAPYLLLTALATGLTLLAKHSGVIILPILVLLAICDAVILLEDRQAALRTMARNMSAVALICIIAFGIVWAFYGMRFSAGRDFPRLQDTGPITSASARVLLALEENQLLPEAYLTGFRVALAISSEPTNFVAGKSYAKTPWFALPFNFLIRNTLAMLGMMGLGAFGLARLLRPNRREFLFLLGPATVYLVVCLTRSAVAIRFLLPIFPFLLIAVAASCVDLGRRVRWVKIAVPCLVVLHAASSLHAFPNYLSYANEFWGGPTRSCKYLPWIDFGQGYVQAKTYLDRHPANDCWVLTGWVWDPRWYNVTCRVFFLDPFDPVPPGIHGTVIVSSNLLSDVSIDSGEITAPFKNAKPKDAIAGAALLVYEGDFDTSAAAAMSEMNRAFSAATRSAALQHGERAVELAPESAVAHSEFCKLLLAYGSLDSALKECYMARKLVLRDPLSSEQPARREFLRMLEERIALLRTKCTLVYEHEPASVTPATNLGIR